MGWLHCWHCNWYGQHSQQHMTTATIQHEASVKAIKWRYTLRLHLQGKKKGGNMGGWGWVGCSKNINMQAANNNNLQWTIDPYLSTQNDCKPFPGTDTSHPTGIFAILPKSLIHLPIIRYVLDLGRWWVQPPVPFHLHSFTRSIFSACKLYDCRTFYSLQVLDSLVWCTFVFYLLRRLILQW